MTNFVGTGTDTTTNGAGYTVETLTSTTPCSWLIPSGVSRIDLLVIGGGGGGGGGAGQMNSNYGGGGGGSGQVIRMDSVSVSGYSSLSLSIGAGGAAGAGGPNVSTGTSPGTCGTSGGATSISELGVISSGGSGGLGGATGDCVGTIVANSGAGGASGNGLAGASATTSNGGQGGNSIRAGSSASGSRNIGQTTYFGNPSGTGWEIAAGGGGASSAGYGGWLTPALSPMGFGSGGGGGRGSQGLGPGCGGVGIPCYYGYSGIAGRGGLIVFRYLTPLPAPAQVTLANLGNAIFRSTIVLNVTSDSPGRITFYANGKAIPGCKNALLAGSGSTYNATCNWKPSVHGTSRITAVVRPSNINLNGSSAPIYVNSVPRMSPR